MLSSQFLFKITLKPQVETVLGAKSSRLVTNISVAKIKLRAYQYWLLLEICHVQILLTPIGKKERKNVHSCVSFISDFPQVDWFVFSDYETLYLCVYLLCFNEISMTEKQQMLR